VLKTTKLRKLVQSEFNPIMEHDAHEFMLYIVNRLKDEVTDKEAKVDTI
jgi:ubiquitin C-terminal hydrolase